MPGSGRAPKAPGARRNHHPPLRGEWVELPPLDRPALPELAERPGEGDWSRRAVETWEAWRSDPVTSQFTASDVAFLVDTLLLVDLCARKPRAALASEIRLRLDNTGLSPKGRQDRRWRLVPAGELVEHPTATAGSRTASRRRRLRAVDPNPNGGKPA